MSAAADGQYIILNPDDAVEIAPSALRARGGGRGSPDARKVRAPRFSDAEWERLERQAFKVRSPKSQLGRPREVTAHEFVWLATMRAVHLLEEVPRGDKPFTIEEVLVSGIAPSPSGKRSAKAAASARDTPVWEGAKLTTGALGLKMDWPQLEKPSGEPPAALVPAMLKEHRARDMRDCPVEIAVRGPQPGGRRRPPTYTKVCCICEWPHALPVNWPFDDGGAQLNEEQRAKLEKARASLKESLDWGLFIKWGDGWGEAAGRRVFWIILPDTRTVGPLWFEDGVLLTSTKEGPSGGLPKSAWKPVLSIAHRNPYSKLKRVTWARIQELGAAGKLTDQVPAEGGAPPSGADLVAEGQTDTDNAKVKVRPGAKRNAQKAVAGGQRRRGSTRPSASKTGEKVPPACGLCEDSGRHLIDDEVCRCRTEDVVCGLCDDEAFYRAGPSLNPCICATGRSLLAKGPAYVKRCRAELRKAKKAARRQASGGPPPGSSDEFYTPSRYFLPLHEEFGFTLDVCATAESAKCERYFTKEQDGLKQSWEGEVWFCNPPFSPGNLAAFVAKCSEEAAKPGHRLGVALLPSRPDRKWWQEHIEPGRRDGSLEVRFHKGRIAFGWPGNPEGLGGDTGRDPVAFVVWRRKA
ncbi:MAG TPA: DNA N-6-adenine-methyltransferase [Myxococcaceae bacterium]|nr:DNA N-6-adenine-methyltransferase [Myxococcaceae bacterium]